MEWQKTLIELKHQHLQKTAPGFYKISGGRSMKVKGYTDVTTNGLTNAIMDYLKYNQHYANRINCMGVMRLIDGKMRHTHSSTRKGVADIHAIINGKHCSIEIKCKATKDRLSDYQIRERQLVENAGGFYFVATDMESFIEWYKSNF